MHRRMGRLGLDSSTHVTCLETRVHDDAFAHLLPVRRENPTSSWKDVRKCYEQDIARFNAWTTRTGALVNKLEALNASRGAARKMMVWEEPGRTRTLPQAPHSASRR